MNIMRAIKTLSLALALLLGLYAYPASATQGTGTVTFLAIGSNVAFIRVSGQSAATCAVQNRYVIDLTGVTGRAMYAMALAARLSGSPITVVGTDSCTIIPNDAENVLNTIEN